MPIRRPASTFAVKLCLCRATVACLILIGVWIQPRAAEAQDQPAQSSRRPNILLAIADDQSFPHAGAYGTRGVNTPAFDRVAHEGVLCTNGFAASPGCSPSRAALLTGRHPWQLEHAGTHASEFPAKYATYPDLLGRAGYFVGYTGKGWGPGNFRISGRTRNPAGPDFNRRKTDSPQGVSGTDYAANFAEFLEERPAGQPFCFWYGGHEPHRAYENGAGRAAGKQLAEASVPSFLPDTPTIRSDILDYYVEIEWFDRHLGRMLKLLEDRGELDDTLVLVTADNGMPFPRAKANCYDYGIHVPLAVRWPARVPGGRTVDDLIGFVDFAPTFLAAAGASIPDDMFGRNFLHILTSDKSGQVDPAFDHVLAARERHSSSRHGNLAYPIRALRTERFLYIRNFRPGRWPAGHPAGFQGDPFGYYDIDGAPSKSFLWEHRDSQEFSRYFHLAVDKRPDEELYDVKDDPGNLHNLADDSQHAEIRRKLKEQLEHTLRQTGDPRIINGGDIFETYKRYSRIRTFPADDSAKPPARWDASFNTRTIDLDSHTHRQVVVDREEGQYLGHPTTVLLEDNRTVLCVYPKGHGRGAIVYKRSADAGLTWSDRLPTPASWETSLEVPTLFRVIGPDGTKRIIMFSGLYPVRMAVTEDDGRTWSELKPVGEWGGIVAMGSVVPLKTGRGRYLALFHDDGRFLASEPMVENPRVMTLLKSLSSDGGLTWSPPESIYASSDIHVCEPGVIRSPDGRQLAMLLRENARRRNSQIMFSDDEGRTWTPPRDMPGSLNGDRHTGKYAPDGRLFISFRARSPRGHSGPFEGDWVAWVGTYEDLVHGREGQYYVRLKDNHKGADCAYPGVVVLPDGIFVTTTYGHWANARQPYILSVRLKLTELDALAGRR